MKDLIEKLQGPLDYGVWIELNDYAHKEQRWIPLSTSLINEDLICMARDYNRTNLLIPVALSLVPDRWRWELHDNGECVFRKKDSVRSFVIVSDYPAAALAIAAIKARGESDAAD